MSDVLILCNIFFKYFFIAANALILLIFIVNIYLDYFRGK
jgi:hypothetical protein